MIKKVASYYDIKLFPRLSSLRGATRLNKLLKNLAMRKVGKVDKEDELDVFEQDWDSLIIIDACRQDFWEEETGMTGERVSLASATVEYIEKNFSDGDFSDVVYVTANPQFSDWKFEKLTGRKPEDVFHSVFKTFNTDWDEDANTVLPEDTVRDAKTAASLFPGKKIVVHFLPPHYPFIRKPLTKGGISKELEGKTDSAWNLAQAGLLDKNDVEESYRDNMQYVQPYVEDLASNLEGKTILTSDHGNLVGEGGFYGHPRDRMEEPLKKVPYYEM